MSKCGIYGFFQISSGKWYVGQSIDIERREKEHRNCIDLDWHQFLLKNPNDFVFTILEECKEEELDLREAYYINLYNSYEQGFNSTRGNHIKEQQQEKINTNVLLTEWRGYTITDEDEQRILRAIQTKSFLKLIQKICIEFEKQYDYIKYDLTWKFDENCFLIKAFPFINNGCKLDDAIFIYLNLENNITKEKQDILFQQQIPKNLYYFMNNIDYYNGPYHNYFYIFNRYGYKCNAIFRVLSRHYNWANVQEIIEDIQPHYVNF